MQRTSMHRILLYNERSLYSQSCRVQSGEARMQRIYLNNERIAFLNYYLFITKARNCQGDLTEVSAKTTSLLLLRRPAVVIAAAVLWIAVLFIVLIARAERSSKLLIVHNINMQLSGWPCCVQACRGDCCSCAVDRGTVYRAHSQGWAFLSTIICSQHK